MATVVDDPYGLGGSGGGFTDTRNRNTNGRGGGNLFPAMPGLAPIQPLGPDRPVRTFGDPGNLGPVQAPVSWADPNAVAAPPTTITPPAPNGLNTLYGVDSESYLTDDQRKLARAIQGQFDASANRRDRELARYGAPRLSSFAEDESLARAMSLARGLNQGASVDPITGAVRQPSGGGGGYGGGSGGGGGRASTLPRIPTYRDPTTGAPRPTADPSNAARWQQIMTGLMSVAPLLFGKDAYGNFLNKGAIQWAKEKISEMFGLNPQYMTDQSLEHIVTTGQMPGYGTGDVGFVYNPITGQYMGGYGADGSSVYTEPTNLGYTDPYESIYQGGNSAGGGYDFSDPDPFAVGGYDWTTPDVNWWDFSGGAGGDYIDLFGGV